MVETMVKHRLFKEYVIGGRKLDAVDFIKYIDRLK